MQTNISPVSENRLAGIFHLLGQPVRLQILFVISGEEACVCHLEAVLNLRQASISQHLMRLREQGLVETHRDGRNIYYRLVLPEIIDLLRQAANVTGVTIDDLENLSRRPIPGCPCPQCNPDLTPDYSCQKLYPRR